MEVKNSWKVSVSEDSNVLKVYTFHVNSFKSMAYFMHKHDLNKDFRNIYTQPYATVLCLQLLFVLLPVLFFVLQGFL